MYTGCPNDRYNKNIWKSVYYTDLEITPFQRKTHQNFIALSIHLYFSVLAPLTSQKIIQTIFDFCPRVLKHVMGYRSHSVPYPGFRLLKVIVFDVVDDVIRLTP